MNSIAALWWHDPKIAFITSRTMADLEHDTLTPDIETSSDGYARRFDGPVGRFLLDSQEQAVDRLLGPKPGQGQTPQTVLEVGGGHGQLTPMLLRRGCRVWVQGSRATCADRLQPLMREDAGQRLRFVASNLWSLPFRDGAFDAVIAIRLMAHVERWRELLAEMARVCRHRLLIDYPPRSGANVLEPLLFSVKRRLEGNTRPYFCYTDQELTGALRALGFDRIHVERQFGVPMVVHRTLRRPAASYALERLSRSIGATRLLGGPALLMAER